MSRATSDDVRDIFLDHLDRLRADYSKRHDDAMAAAAAAADCDGWTAGLERGLAMAYGATSYDLAQAIEVERGLMRAVTTVPGSL